MFRSRKIWSRKKVSVSVSQNLVSEKCSVSVSVKILVFSFSGSQHYHPPSICEHFPRNYLDPPKYVNLQFIYIVHSDSHFDISFYCRKGWAFVIWWDITNKLHCRTISQIICRKVNENIISIRFHLMEHDSENVCKKTILCTQPNLQTKIPMTEPSLPG